MEETIYIPAGSQNFESISDFKDCMRCGGEVGFIWKGVTYGVVRKGV